MQTTIVERRICLHPSLLGKGIKKSLIDKARISYANECTKKHGYMMSVDDIVDIVDNTITSANSDAVFTVKFRVQILKPERTKSYSGLICMIIATGIFVDIDKKLKILIPRAGLDGYTFQKNLDGNMEFAKDNISLVVGVPITVSVSDIKYSSGCFSCFGELKENDTIAKQPREIAYEDEDEDEDDSVDGEEEEIQSSGYSQKDEEGESEDSGSEDEEVDQEVEEEVDDEVDEEVEDEEVDEEVEDEDDYDDSYE
jgi:DNA-directed RNA polymerase subunit E'/Rpb7